MARAPLVLLLAAAASAAGGVWEEVGRNTDVTLDASLRSRWVEEGRAPDVGPAASLAAVARLSVPASALNLELTAGADRSIDGAPRLDRRRVGLTLLVCGESAVGQVGIAYRDHLGENPASPGHSLAETSYTLGLSTAGSAGNPSAWSCGIELAAVPRREESRAEVWAGRLIWSAESLRLDLELYAGTLRATDADGDGTARVESWSYGKAGLALRQTLASGSELRLEVATQAATEAPGRAPGVVTLGWSRTF